MKLSLIAPMYNEEANVERTYRLVTEELDRAGYLDRELIFVNDGSTDSTWEKAKALAKKKDDLIVLGYSHNQGRGKALRTGFDTASGDFVLSFDFDLSYSPDHLTRMLDYLKQHPEIDVVLTSCYLPGGKTEGVPRVRLWSSKLGNYLLR
ncbi:MAG: glycosyltransferase family 2 protein, partial [Verrucomicrobiota bacterium]